MREDERSANAMMGTKRFMPKARAKPRLRWSFALALVVVVVVAALIFGALR